jgi:hypothetical protein
VSDVFVIHVSFVWYCTAVVVTGYWGRGSQGSWVREGWERYGFWMKGGYILEIVSKMAFCFSVNCSFSCFPIFVASYIWNCSIVLSFLLFCWYCKSDMQCCIGCRAWLWSIRCFANSDLLETRWKSRSCSLNRILNDRPVCPTYRCPQCYLFIYFLLSLPIILPLLFLYHCPSVLLIAVALITPVERCTNFI